MSGNKVENNVHSESMRFLKKFNKIVVCAVSRSDCAIVLNVIARIAERREKAWVYPYRVAAELLNISELFGYAVNVSYTVRIGILERLRINLVKNCVIKPLCHNKNRLSA